VRQATIGRVSTCKWGSINVSLCGACTSANAGTSSVKVGEKPARRKSKVSWATLIVPGSVGTKPRPKGVGDGQLVHIPVPPRVRYHRRGDEGGQANRTSGCVRPRS